MFLLITVLAGAAGALADAPGEVHRIRLGDLPAPFATPSAANPARVNGPPAPGALAVPAGFRVAPFTTELKGPRRMAVAGNGDIFVTQTSAGRVAILHPSVDGKSVARIDVFAQGLKQPFGIAFYPNAARPEWLYVAEMTRVVRYPYTLGEVSARSAPEPVITDLPPGGHFTRDIAFSPDGTRLYLAVGSRSNVPESLSVKSAAETAAWEAAYGVGAAWDAETHRADVLVYAAPRPAQANAYANGIRNCVSLTVQPATGALWCTVNERDGLGDDLVPDYATRVVEGRFYGWPWYYLGAHPDPRLKGRPDLEHQVAVPDLLFQAHSAALNLTFYVPVKGASAFPAEYAGDGFVAFHGSWNRRVRTGYKLVRVRMKNDAPTGEYEDFLIGFLPADGGDVGGRPVATVELADGSLLMSDDGADVIYRISYSPG